MNEGPGSNRATRKKRWPTILWVVLSAVWIAFTFYTRTEDNKRIALANEQIARDNERLAAEGLAYNSAYEIFQKRLSGEVEKWARNACALEAQNPRSTVKRGFKFDEKECVRQAVQDHVGSGYPSSIELCTLVANAGRGLKLDVHIHNPTGEFDELFNATGRVESSLEKLPCDVPMDRVASSNKDVTGEKLPSEYLPWALFPPIVVAVVLWGISAIYSRLRKSNFANLLLSAVSTRAFRFGVAALLVYEFWLGFWVFFSDDWNDSHDWPEDWLISAVVVPLGILASYLAYRWAVAPNTKSSGNRVSNSVSDNSSPSGKTGAVVTFEAPTSAIGAEQPPSIAAQTDSHPQLSSSQKITSNYFVRHWRGELSLGIAYWINGNLASFAPIALMAIVDHVKSDYSTRALSIANVSILLFAVIAWLWCMVGIWRSANHHVARGGTAPWAIVARLLVVVGITAMAGKLYVNIIPQVEELALIASGNDPIGDVSVKVSANGRSVIVVGTLREGSADEIQKIIDAAPSASSLVLNSNGGRAHEAQQLAHIVRNRHLDTYVEDQCVSACTYVFLAGKDRAAMLSCTQF